MFQPRLEYSEYADCAYVYLGEGDFARTRMLDDRRIIDLATDGSVIGVEFVDVSGGVDLEGIPERAVVAGLLSRLREDRRTAHAGVQAERIVIPERPGEYEPHGTETARPPKQHESGPTDPIGQGQGDIQIAAITSRPPGNPDRSDR